MIVMENIFKNRNLKPLKDRIGEQSSAVVQCHLVASKACSAILQSHSMIFRYSGNMVCPSLGVSLILHVRFLPWL